MRIGIDISQIIYEGTGVGEYTRKLVEKLLRIDSENEYILFFANFSKKFSIFNFQFSNKSKSQNPKVKVIYYKIPINILEFIWNKLHIFPIEWFIGDVDVFLTSDWLEPPTKRAKKATTIHDLSVLKLPETFDQKIVEVHKRKLKWVKKESTLIMCDSLATKKNAMDILGIEEKRLKVVYPGGGEC